MVIYIFWYQKKAASPKKAAPKKAAPKKAAKKEASEEQPAAEAKEEVNLLIKNEI